MAKQSSMLPLGTTAPNFTLINPANEELVSLTSIKGIKGTCVMILSNHCPYVRHILPKLVEMIPAYQDQGVAFVGINANDVDLYPDDSPDKMKTLSDQMQFSFPYLFDETQEIVKSYQAECTPEFYLFDHELLCVYRGRFDSSTPKNDHEVSGSDLKSALNQLILGETIQMEQLPSIGCGIKWKQ
jgi:peroxiredoxin